MFPRWLLVLALIGHASGQAVHFEWVQQIGGSVSQTVAGVGTDPLGNTYIAGTTSSLDFPVKGALQAVPGGSGLYRIDATGQMQNLYRAGLPSVSVLTSDPTDSATLYAISVQNLYRTEDLGGSWHRVAGFNVALTGLAVDPTAGNTLYLSTAGSGMFQSTDRGVTWKPINQGLKTDAQDGKRYAYGVWVDPNLPAVIFANTEQGVARSSDSGATWSYTPLTGLSVLGNLAFDPASPGMVYAPGVLSIQKSTDDGVTWTSLPAPAMHQFEPSSVVLDPQHPGTIYVGSYNGLWKSTDGGNTWIRKSGDQVLRLTIDARGVIYFADNGTLSQSADGLDTMTKTGPAIPLILTLAVQGGQVFVGTQGNTDVYVAKLDPQGNIVYATYFGGSSSDQANALAVDNSGAVYVTGYTASTDFPVSSGAFAQAGTSFLFKLNPDGTLGYSTYFAPGGNTPAALAVDSAGNAYLAGVSTGNLPITSGAYQATFQGTIQCCNIIGPGLPPPTNGFLSKFDPAGGKLVFSTYFGSQSVAVTSMALAPNGETILAGGNRLYRLSADGSSMVKTAQFSGNISTLLSDASGGVYAGGTAQSYYPTPIPITPNAFETTPAIPSLSATAYGFVTHFDDQFNVVASTLLAGESGDATLALALARDGNLFAGGSTFSKSFPSRGAVQGPFSPQGTGFLSELTGDLSSLVFSTYAGDTRAFSVRSLAPTPDGGVIFAGFTTDGYSQAFTGKAAAQPAMPRIDSVVNAASLLGTGLSPGVTFVVKGAGFGDDAELLVNGSPLRLTAQGAESLTAALPLDFTANGAVAVAVQSGGATSNTYLAPFLAAGPGIFSVDGTSQGRAYVLNSDGTLNSPANPAKPGSEITIYATGVGHMSFTDGYAVTDAPVIVAVDGFGAPGIAAVWRPVQGFPGNVYQISVYVPDPASYAAVNSNFSNFVFPPMSPITIQVSGVTSQNGLWVSISK